MPITRIFRVQIDATQRVVFEEKFASISVSFVNAAQGLISVTIYKPTIWAPDEYSMISAWQDEKALQKFAGDDWSRAKIPHGMETFIKECWVHHYVSWS